MTSTLRALALAAVPALGLAAGPSAPAADPAAIGDVLATRAALAAVDADPALRGASLVVSVVDRVAVVGGAVPSAEVGRRAEAVVRAVPGVEGVKNRCFVETGPGPLIRPVVDTPSLLPRRAAADPPGAVPLSGPGPAVAAPVVPPPADPPAERTVVTLRPTAPAPDLLGPPVGAVPGAVRAVGPHPPTGETAGVLTARPAGPLAAVEAVRKTDPRFAGLTIELRDGTAVVGGTAARAADAWELAQNLRAVPGVARVAVGAVGVK